jgi:hypothetical protein
VGYIAKVGEALKIPASVRQIRKVAAMNGMYWKGCLSPEMMPSHG